MRDGMQLNIFSEVRTKLPGQGCSPQGFFCRSSLALPEPVESSQSTPP